MKRRQQRFNTFPNLDTLIEAFILLFIIFGIPYLLGYYGCQFLFNGSTQDCREWGSLIMISTPAFFYIIDRILNIFGINIDKN